MMLLKSFKSIFKGETKEEIIHVYWYGNTTEFMYRKNSKYYLALQRWIDVYYPHDRYGEIYSVYIRPGYEKKFTVKIEKIMQNAEDTYQKRGWTIETKPYYGTDYIHSEELADIVDGSDTIFLMRVKRINKGVVGPDTCECAVLEMLKGTYDYKVTTLNLLEGTAEEGKEYILLATTQPGGIFRLSSRNSLQPAEKREEIEKLVGVSCNEYQKT